MLFDDPKETPDEETEVEETEDESTETDDSEEASDEGAKGGKKTTAGKGDEPPDVETFINPNDLPDEVKPHFKRMQAAFTKKMQALSNDRNKAEAFDELVAMPEFRTFMTKLKEGGLEEKATEKKGDKKEGEPTIQELVEAGIAKALAPILAENGKNKVAMQIQAELAAFTKEYPDWESYKAEMLEVIRERENKGQSLTYEDAYKIVTHGINGQVLKEKKKAANVNKSGGPAIGKKPPSKAKTILEAFEQAEKELAEK